MAKKLVDSPEKQIRDEIIVKLDIIIKLLANNVVNNKNSTETTVYLHKIGLSNKEIAEALNLKYNIVSAMLSNAKKAKTK